MFFYNFESVSKAQSINYKNRFLARGNNAHSINMMEMHLAYLLHVASCQYIPHEQIQQTERRGTGTCMSSCYTCGYYKGTWHITTVTPPPPLTCAPPLHKHIFKRSVHLYVYPLQISLLPSSSDEGGGREGGGWACLHMTYDYGARGWNLHYP